MQNRKKRYLIISIISLVVVVLALLSIGVLLYSYRQSRDAYNQLAQDVRTEAPDDPLQPTAAETTGQTMPTAPPVDIPINFEALEEENEDIIGWIIVDGTVIDYPILYDDTNMLYYLTHNYAGTATGYGSIFVLSQNDDDFTDFNTVVYGHNMLDGQMFAQLHKFRNQTFFDEHGEILIYTPDRKLTYQVFAAYRTDNLNIMVNNDFSTEALRQDYLDRVYAHKTLALFDETRAVTPSDRIVTLSTCIGDANYRYVVQGVLVSDEYGVFNPTPAEGETEAAQ